jgi:hypothetical protein
MRPENFLDGKWIGEPPVGGTLTLSHHGQVVTGHGTGGRGHERLTNQVELRGKEALYSGTYTNQEGVVTGSGKVAIKIVNDNTIEFSWDGHWSGGGTSGHTNGKSILHRGR